MPATDHVFISGYTEDGYGAGPGLVRYALLADGMVGEPAAHSEGVANPSFLAAAGNVLLAVEERADGGIVALDPETLTTLGRRPSGGADPCHVLHQDGDVWVANYSSGTASVTALADLLAGGAEAPATVSHPGSGPVADRQGESHAHQVTATPWGTFLVADLGSDRVDEYRPVRGTAPVLVDSADLPPGTGPRHVAIRGEHLLVAGELDGFLHVLRRTEMDPARGEGHYWQWQFKTPLAATTEEIEAAEQFYASHIQLSADGATLYAAVRGPNTVVVLDVGGLDTGAAPVLTRSVDCGGNWPRHFAIGDAKMYVANQLSNNVAVFALDPDGVPGGQPVQTVDFGSPTCILLG